MTDDLSTLVPKLLGSLTDGTRDAIASALVSGGIACLFVVPPDNVHILASIDPDGASLSLYLKQCQALLGDSNSDGVLIILFDGYMDGDDLRGRVFSLYFSSPDDFRRRFEFTLSTLLSISRGEFDGRARKAVE